MNNYSIELRLNANLAPTTEIELKGAAYSLIAALDHLFCSSVGKEASMCNYIDWENTLKQNQMVEGSALWDCIYPMWEYAENGGEVPNIYDDLLGDLAKWLSAVNGYCEYHGDYFNHHIIKVILKCLAKLKLINKLDPNELVTLSSGWFPQFSEDNFTLVELALLAGMKNIRTVRNAQYDKEEPLSFIKKGGQVLVTREHAVAWLAKRKGFDESILI
jgi:hypothetical protein